MVKFLTNKPIIIIKNKKIILENIWLEWLKGEKIILFPEIRNQKNKLNRLLAILRIKKLKI
jgi:hypothetical protein